MSHSFFTKLHVTIVCRPNEPELISLGSIMLTCFHFSFFFVSGGTQQNKNLLNVNQVPHVFHVQTASSCGFGRSRAARRHARFFRPNEVRGEESCTYPGLLHICHHAGGVLYLTGVQAPAGGEEVEDVIWPSVGGGTRDSFSGATRLPLNTRGTSRTRQDGT